VAWEGGRLVVDAWEETVGDDDAAKAPPAAPADQDDHMLADDDPLLEPRPAGGGR